MSTRCNIVFREFGDIWFYRHSDGYPKGTLPSLKRFMRLVESGRIRNNASQASGWLVIIGYDEYIESDKRYIEQGYSQNRCNLTLQELEKAESNSMSWQVGAYEPTTGQHGDIEFLYEINLGQMAIHVTDICNEANNFTVTDFSAEDSDV